MSMAKRIYKYLHLLLMFLPKTLVNGAKKSFLFKNSNFYLKFGRVGILKIFSLLIWFYVSKQCEISRLFC